MEQRIFASFADLFAIFAVKSLVPQTTQRLLKLGHHVR